ncbi:MAG TPA: S8 family serine peptidase [Jatrophihabitantaceae bacterium]|nr:S8 family serine peptidase [Jatrophihabitantaceae bacterium]
MLAWAASVSQAASAHADAVQSSQWYLDTLGVRHAWTISRGAGVVVAVIDSGVDGRIADLTGAVVGGADFSSAGSRNGQRPVEPDSRHGTNVASLISGHGHGPGHTSGILGTAPAAHLLTASCASQTNPDGTPAAIRWAVDHGATVLNLSYTSADPGEKAAVQYAQSKDVVVVASTGDSFVTQRVGLQSPAVLPGVLAVTGIDQNLKSDPAATIGRGTALAAPFSTTPVNPDSARTKTGLAVADPRGDVDGPYQLREGTSFSAPIVAGIVALVRAHFPHMDAANVINRLLKTAMPAGGSVPNDIYGYGVVNAYQALTEHVAPVAANPLGSLVPSGGSSPAPSGSSSASSAPRTSSPPTLPAQSAPPASSAAPVAGSGSSGLGAGGWAAIAAVIVVAAAVIGALVGRSRRPRGTPPGYPPQRPRL